MWIEAGKYVSQNKIKGLLFVSLLSLCISILFHASYVMYKFLHILIVITNFLKTIQLSSSNPNLSTFNEINTFASSDMLIDATIIQYNSFHARTELTSIHKYIQINIK